MAKKLYLIRLLVALFFFASIFALSLIFTTFRILSSETIGRNIAAFGRNPRLQEVRVETDTSTKKVFVNNHDFWKEYYNDDRFGRSWNFNISQKYDASRLREYETVVVKQKDVGRPGEMGSAPKIPPEQADLQSQLFQKYNFNFLASNMMSVQRSFPDIRYPECKNITYLSALPTASVIIIFHNEPWALLVRTIWGVINKSPSELLKEIVVVDDLSDLDYLDKPLDDYLELLPAKVVHVRTKKREGLTRARVIGARNATGDVLIFLDAHVDCLEGWLEPILNRIANDRSVIAVPHVNSVDLWDQRLIQSQKHEYHFGWDWDLMFKGWPPTEEEMKRRHGDKTVPVRTVTMIGCAFAIDREFFFEVGSYDEGLDIWGSENMEISLRVWLCGGAMEIIPCSHTTHLFRTSTYSFEGEKQLIKTRNNVRVAKVWLDDYIEYFYMYFPEGRNMNVGDLTERMELKKKLKCQKFQWIVDNVFTQSLMRSIYVNMGQIATKSGSRCLDTFRGGRKARLRLYECNQRASITQGFVYFKTKQLAYAETECVELGKRLSSENQTRAHEIIFAECDAKTEMQKWEHDEKDGYVRFKHSKTGLCMQESDSYVIAQECVSNESQLWKWRSTLPTKPDNSVAQAQN